jgi:hypothetical protein
LTNTSGIVFRIRRSAVPFWKRREKTRQELTLTQKGIGKGRTRPFATDTKRAKYPCSPIM